jgi:hypothetical protein
MKPDVLTRTAFAAAATAAVLVPLAGCSGADPGTRSPSSGPSTTSAASSPRPSSSSSSSSGGTEYKGRNLHREGYYGSAPSYLTVTVILSAGTITSVTVEPMPNNNAASCGYQERFAAAVPGVVVCKSIDEVKVGKLPGSGGCPDGFNDAVAKIRDQASAGN